MSSDKELTLSQYIKFYLLLIRRIRIVILLSYYDSVSRSYTRHAVISLGKFRFVRFAIDMCAREVYKRKADFYEELLMRYILQNIKKIKNG